MRLTPSMQTCCSTRELGAFNGATQEQMQALANKGTIPANSFGAGGQIREGETVVFVDMPKAGVGIGISYQANAKKWLVPAIHEKIAAQKKAKKKQDYLYESPLVNKKTGNEGVHIYVWTFEKAA